MIDLDHEENVKRIKQVKKMRKFKRMKENDCMKKRLKRDKKRKQHRIDDELGKDWNKVVDYLGLLDLMYEAWIEAYYVLDAFRLKITILRIRKYF